MTTPSKTCSLSILLPSKPTLAYAHQTKKRSLEDPTEYILQRSRDLVECFNRRDFVSAIAYASPSFRARHNNLPLELTREQHFGLYQQMLTATDWRMKIFGEHAEVDEVEGNALVWFFVKITGEFDEGVARDSLGLLHWQRTKEGEWIVVYHVGFRSCGIF